MTTKMPVKLLIIGEAWGSEEQTRSLSRGRPSPFVGKAGYLLRRLMGNTSILPPAPAYYPGPLGMEAEWEEAESHGIYLTNVFQLRPGPESNDLTLLTGSKKNHEPSELILDYPALVPNGHCLFCYRPELDRLHDEISSLKPNLILLLGTTACWAVLHNRSIGRIKGAIHLIDDQKILPTYHPAAILHGRKEWIPILHNTLTKAQREMQSRTYHRPDRVTYIPETPDDIFTWWETYGIHSPRLSVDIETEANRFISEIGIAASATNAIWIPFLLKEPKTRRLSSYWSDTESESLAWLHTRSILTHGTDIIGQNFLYDIQYLMAKSPSPGGIIPRKFSYDTMINQHALFPGQEKSLGHLTSIYCNETFWKDLRRSQKSDDVED